MGFTTERLNLPESPPESKVAPEKESTGTLADQLGQSKLTLEERVARQLDGTLNVPDPTPEPVETEEPVKPKPKAKPAPRITACPNCNSKLSAFEVKMTHCMACGHAWNPEDEPSTGFTIGI